ncbi:MAG: IS4 family transposase [Magnetococcales bacterium]|nr:IS4 family transposase [Magnetococcales bacterium]
MGDNAKRFRIIRKELTTLFPGTASGNVARHLNTLAAMMSGIIGAKNVHLPEVASKAPNGTKLTSREKKFVRWVRNKRIEIEEYFLPFAQLLMARLAQIQEALVIAIDGSSVGRGNIALMANVIFKGRALPITWIVLKGKKGHLPEELHLRLMEQIQALIPSDTRVVILGDGEFDGVRLLETVSMMGWDFSCRTSKSIILNWEGYEFSCREIEKHMTEGEYIDVCNCLFKKDKHGPVRVVCWWREDCKEPIYLVSNLTTAEEVCDQYALRFRIETFFSDQKTRGFQIQRSHLSNPERLSRLLIAACLAYIWVVYLGELCKESGKAGEIHRCNRIDLSLFQLGFRWLEHLLNEGLRLVMPLKRA